MTMLSMWPDPFRYRDVNAFRKRDASPETIAVMSEPTAREVLAENLRNLFDAKIDKKGIQATAREMQIGSGGFQNALTGKKEIRIDTLATIAAYFGVAPWQLLVPGLAVKDLPDLGGGWPFKAIDQTDFESLTDVGKGMVEMRIADAIEAARKAGHTKRRQA